MGAVLTRLPGVANVRTKKTVLKGRKRRGLASPDPKTLVPVKGLKGYFVTREGKLYSVHQLMHEGFRVPYKVATVYDAKGRRISLPIHRIVCETFHGRNPPGKHEVRHLDGNPLNDSADNLAWGSHYDNGQDMVRHGINRGTNNPMAKLSIKAIKSIRTTRITVREYAARFQVSQGRIRAIQKGSGLVRVYCSREKTSKLIKERPLIDEAKDKCSRCNRRAKSHPKGKIGLKVKYA